MLFLGNISRPELQIDLLIRQIASFQHLNMQSFGFIPVALNCLSFHLSESIAYWGLILLRIRCPINLSTFKLQQAEALVI